MQQSGDPLRIQVFNTLEDAILNGSYKEGDSLNELRLSKSLGVSRTPVREALMQLELEGLVKNIHNKGAVVAGVSPIFGAVTFNATEDISISVGVSPPDGTSIVPA